MPRQAKPRADRSTKPRAASRAAVVNHCFGSHLSVAGGVENAITAALELGFDTVQIFVKNQRQWRAPPLAAESLRRWRERLESSKGFGPTVAHASYLVNLAAADESLWDKSRDAFVEELRRCDQLGVPYLVVHPGAAGEQPRDAALARVAESLNRIAREHPSLRTMTLLEATAGQGSALGRRLEELGAILDQVQRPERVGVCLDSCHLFAAGYDLRDPQIYEAAMRLADQVIGLQRVRCWHLNDSKGDLGSRVDRHEHIGHGHIGDAGFVNILADPRWHGVPKILETEKEDGPDGRPWDAVNLDRLRAIAKRAARRRT